jgi:hypothetical protein
MKTIVCRIMSFITIVAKIWLGFPWLARRNKVNDLTCEGFYSARRERYENQLR